MKKTIYGDPIEEYKVGDKVTAVGIGIGYIRSVESNGYFIYFTNLKTTGAGYLDRDLQPGWPQ